MYFKSIITTDQTKVPFSLKVNKYLPKINISNILTVRLPPGSPYESSIVTSSKSPAPSYANTNHLPGQMNYQLISLKVPEKRK